MTIDELTRRHTLAALHRHGGNKAATAAELGVAVKTVYNWLNRWTAEGHDLAAPPPVETDETRRLKALVLSLADRVAKQSELLSKRAENKAGNEPTSASK